MSELPPRDPLPPKIPVRLERYDAGEPPPSRRPLLHPQAGLLILTVDWLFFGPEFVTAEAAAIVTSPLAFLITSLGVYWVQRRKNHDARGAALLKAFVGGVVAAIPTSIAGTIVGTAVLMASGLSGRNQRGAR
jgi:drug/metabolite transporter (DMT)-like permease